MCLVTENVPGTILLIMGCVPPSGGSAAFSLERGDTDHTTPHHTTHTGDAGVSNEAVLLCFDSPVPLCVLVAGANTYVYYHAGCATIRRHCLFRGVQRLDDIASFEGNAWQKVLWATVRLSCSHNTRTLAAWCAERCSFTEKLATGIGVTVPSAEWCQSSKH